MAQYVEVAVAAPVHGVFHYAVPAELAASIRPGSALRVQFGRRRLTAYALSAPGESLPATLAPDKVRDIEGLDTRGSGLAERLLPLALWISRRYFAAIGEVIQAMLPAPVRRGIGEHRETFVLPAVPRKQLEAASADLAARSPRQAAILEVLAQAVEEALPQSLLLREAAAPVASLKSLLRKGLLRLEKREPEEEPLPSTVEPAPPYVLTAEQQTALATIMAVISRPGGVALLFGITGSGKTELYIRAIEQVVERGRQAILLVPEISLTPQTVERFRARFRRVAVLHSALTPARRAAYWRQIASGQPDVVIGARSAVFAPLPRLGAIVVDEEHESTYKQENTPRYHAVETAIERARLEGAGVILGSATPSLESLEAARSGRYALARLHQRPTGGTLPPVEIVDMRSEIQANRGYVLVSRRLRLALEEALKAGEQTILFLNRRGFSTCLYCPVCGHVGTCPHCDVALTYHMRSGTLLCHYCEHRQKPPANCPICQTDRLLYLGSGTERVEDVLASYFPQVRLARLDSDVARRRCAYYEILGAFRSRSIDVLVGTQMIAKGLDFPNVSLVGVINADIGLNLADFRASERTVQIISQVAGRAGRAAVHGRVIVQTASPHNPALTFAASHDYEAFAATELENRRRWQYPPFAYLARIVLSGKDRKKVLQRATACAAALTPAAQERGASLLGPAPCVHQRLRGLFRFHLLIKAPAAEALEAIVAASSAALASRAGIDVTLDVNPQSFL